MEGINSSFNFNGAWLVITITVFIGICEVVKYWMNKSKKLDVIKNKLGEHTFNWMIKNNKYSYPKKK